MITVNQRMLVLRVNDYKKYHFAAEHKKQINANGNVWMLKVGRQLSEKTVSTIVEDGGFLILKEPKASGGKYYISHICDIHNGNPISDMIYPSYYEELKEDIPLYGTWLKIDELMEIREDSLCLFELDSKPKKMTEVVSSTRSPILIVHLIKESSMERLVKK